MNSNNIYFEDLYKSNLFFTNKFKKDFLNFIKKGKYILSNYVDQFERDFAKYNNVRCCVGVGNGLDALTISLKALELDKNSEVIVGSNVYIACIIAIINANLKPILVEPNILTYNIDAQEVEKKITKNTKAILAVHMYGKACDMIKLKEISSKNKLYLIEDCAQSHGASISGKLTGSFGDLGCFSFYPTKNLGALGDGGAITTSNKNLYKKIRKIRNYGSEIRYKNEILGVNSRLDEFQAAFLSTKLKYLDLINNRKITFANIYEKYLDSHLFYKPVKQQNYKDVFYIYNIRHEKRDKLKKYLLNKNIQTDIHYPTPPYKQRCFRNMFKFNYPISEKIHSTTLSLPISFSHTKDDIYRVVEVLNSFK
jgi:dTDP-4-amino-4,6-dideoxygalactose transaminase